ncbi:MAG: DEAD/DEAH box helicase [Deltaproteobacteria bacterium]|nr:DEAD/DEAH box helicase [Deltaproteobacteria bacterium]MBI4223941.1 DEAD/DEAH box helicase [Deltaproteobacteria bacterium]
MMNHFSALGITPQILEVLDRLHFETPTPIQHQSIPPCLAGSDVIGIAQTGTGKTLAYALPMIQRFQTMQGHGLILLPTRELALQVDEAIRKIAKQFGMGTVVLIGQESMGRQLEALRRRPRIFVATPGRLLDHLQRRTLSLHHVKILVLDEADRMLDMGFAPQINRIFGSLPGERQTLLYSATMPSGIVRIAASHMKLPVRVEVAPSGTAPEKVEQEIIVVHKESKQALLETILQEHAGTVLVFARTKRGANKICRNLFHKGFESAEIHSNRTQSQRQKALEGFRRGRHRILVATDIASRGLDISHISLVINYDLPDNSEDYVHRIGRTARAGREGKAISFATPDQRNNIRGIEKLIRKTLKIVSKKPFSLSPEIFSARPAVPHRRGRHSFFRRR